MYGTACLAAALAVWLLFGARAALYAALTPLGIIAAYELGDLLKSVRIRPLERWKARRRDRRPPPWPNATPDSCRVNDVGDLLPEDSPVRQAEAAGWEFFTRGSGPRTQ